jgi:hypothetical protein
MKRVPGRHWLGVTNGEEHGGLQLGRRHRREVLEMDENVNGYEQCNR